MTKIEFAKIIYILPMAAFLALLPYSGKCQQCAGPGAVCGKIPTWKPCCEPNIYECKMAEGEDFGTCELKEGAEDEE